MKRTIVRPYQGARGSVLENRRRDYAILDRRLQGQTYNEISSDFGLTRQRAQQIGSKLQKRLVRKAQWHARGMWPRVTR